MTPDLVMPVGFPLGVWAPDGEPEYCVRLGREIVAVSAVEYDLWWQSRFHASTGRLLDWARQDGVPMPGRTVEALLSAGLLAEVDSTASAPFDAAHRLVSAGAGAGYDDTSADGLLGICDAGAVPLVRVDPATYLCWALSDGTRSLADVLQQVLTAADVTPAQLWPALRSLVELGAGHLDRMVD